MEALGEHVDSTVRPDANDAPPAEVSTVRADIHRVLGHEDASVGSATDDRRVLNPRRRRHNLEFPPGRYRWESCTKGGESRIVESTPEAQSEKGADPSRDCATRSGHEPPARC